ncbi:NACHT, LRR and PYD domains-containing protein 8 [Phodopus roborovskii]|uniref:NACHT, LRR and PYD domains-containing protein 8 n=1 Tax=Phodopus roborovskii TaxID=109678 RepID=UPI0021E50FA6|nr:NACHT, LRR and PYD domains-containing protein 8 [Phodopus roborovskii]
MRYMSYLSHGELQIFKRILINCYFLPYSVSITWEEVDSASWAEVVHLLIDSLPGVRAWGVAHEILNRMNQRRISLLVQQELMDEIQKYKQCVIKEATPVWDNTIWPGNQADFLYVQVEKHEAILQCLFLPRKPHGTQPKTVVIHGIPGIGKTTLARMIMVMWAYNRFYAHKFKYAFYFHCRELAWAGERSFSELIEGQRLRPRALVSKILSSPDQLLLMFDGFEELSFPLITDPAGLMEDWNKKLPGSVLLSSLLSKTMLPEATLLIMVRPTSWDGIKLLVKHPFHATLTGFNKTEVLNYLRLHFTSKMTSNQAVDFVMRNTTLLSMCQVPVVCWVVCCCLKNQIQNMVVDLTKACPNATSVFVLYLGNLFRHVFKKFPHGHYQNQLEGLCHLAAQGMWGLKSVFNKSDFQYFMVDETTIDIFLHTNILRKLEGQGDRYVFALFTFQELFGALFYVLFFPQRMVYYHSLSLLNIWHLIEVSREKKSCAAQMGLFFFGLLNEQCVNIVERSFNCKLCLANKLKATKVSDREGYDHSQLFLCLTETREESFAVRVLERCQGVSLKIENQEDLQTSAFCLQCCRDLKKVELTLSEDFYKDLWHSSADSSSSYVIRMNENKIVFNWWQDICSVFETTENLEMLAVSDSHLEAPIMQIFNKALRQPELRLEYHKATPRDCQRRTPLRTLLLRKSRLYVPGINHLIMSHVRELALENCGLSEVYCEGIAFSLRHNKMLTHLSLAENSLKDAGSKPIWNALAYLMCPLQRLVLRQCFLTSACCEYMASALKNNKSLRSLDLSCNKLGDNGVILLCDALANADCNVLILELEECSFTSSSCHAMASMLRSHKKLMHLDLSKNVIRLDGILTLSLAFLYHRNMENVILKKKSNEKVDVYTRLKGPEIEDGRLKIVQDWNS